MTSQAKEKYTVEFKENAVKRANESSDVAETARELGVKENTLYNWVYKYSRPVNADSKLIQFLKYCRFKIDTPLKINE